MIMGSKIDFEQLKREIRKLNRTQALYRLLRDELTKLDHWKQQGRGDPIKAYHSRKVHKND
jgi:hypothetical protein